MTTLADLRLDVTDTLARPRLAVNFASFLRSAEFRITNAVRPVALEKVASLEVSAETSTADLPTDFISMITARVIGSNIYDDLTYVSPDQLLRAGYPGFVNTDLSSREGYYSIVNNKFAIPSTYIANNGNPVDGDPVTAELNYHAKAAPLVNDADTNEILTNGYLIYRTACLIQACEHIRDTEGIALYMQGFNEAVQAYSETQNDARWNAGAATSSGSPQWNI